MTAASSSNASLLFCSSVHPDVFSCIRTYSSATMIASYTSANLLLLLPIYVLTLWTGFRHRQRHRGVTAEMSHSDIITYHMVALETVGVVGSALYSGAIYLCSGAILTAGYFTLAFAYPGQSFFHCLNCMERYLAIVHPITYMSLRRAGGAKVRNVSIGCVWLLCVAMAGLTALIFPDFPSELLFLTLALCTAITSFCSLSALRVLIGLGLGKVGGARDRIDQSKRRAFQTIMAILGALMMRFAGILVSSFMFNMDGQGGKCLVMVLGFWLCLPSSLVLPLLFLHRARKAAAHLESREPDGGRVQPTHGH